MVRAVRPRARKQPAEVRREEILAAAVRVFAHTPYRAAGTAEIAREAGVAEPTIYRHFSSKRELYLAAVEQCGTVVRDTFRELAARTPDAHEALLAMGHWYEQTITTDPDVLRLRQRAVAEAEDEDVREVLQHKYEDILAIITDVIRLGQEQGVFTREITAEGGAWLFTGVGQVLDCTRLMGMDPSRRLALHEQLAAACHRALVVAGK